MSDQLLTVDQVADLLHISRPTVYKLFEDGRLSSLTIGRARRIPRSEVDRFIAERLDAAGVA